MRAFKVPFFIITAIVLLIIVANHFLDGRFWNGWQIEPSIFEGCFCEHNYMERFIRQPMNTWSNVAFLFSGVIILYQTANRTHENNNYLKRQKIISIGYGILLCILFCGSFLFHASLTTFFGITDMIGTYGIPLFIAMIAISRILVYKNILTEKHAAIACIIITYMIGFALAVHWIIFINMIITFAGLLLLAAATSFYLLTRKDLKFNKRLFYGNTIMLLLACLLWIIDHNNIICDPDSVIQGHSFWHVLNGIVAYYMFQLFYTEQTT